MAGAFDASGNNPNRVADGGSIEDFAAKKAAVITKSNENELVQISRGIYVGGTGHLNVEMAGDPPGTATLFSAIPVGTLLPIQVRKVLSTGTTATLIVALF